MDVRKKIQAILSQKMDRQDFMKHVAIAVVALTGAGTALRLLVTPKDGQSVANSDGYGGSAYGGEADGDSRKKPGGIS